MAAEYAIDVVAVRHLMSIFLLSYSLPSWLLFDRLQVRKRFGKKSFEIAGAYRFIYKPDV